MKKFIKEYLTYSKSDRIGITILAFIVLLLIAAPFALRWMHEDEAVDFTVFKKEIAALDTVKGEEPYVYSNKGSQKENISLDVHYTPFDPNIADENTLQTEGLTAKQAHTVINFRSKGGHFYKKEDLQKIYGISAEQYSSLAPYISIIPAEKPLYTSSSAIAKTYTRPAVPLIDITTADSATLLQLKGIGPAFAGRIVNYRNKLGGFVKQEQLKEVYGIDSAKYQMLSTQISAVSANHIKPLNINTASADDLKKHPYIKNYNIANAIVNYRKQHVKFFSKDDLKHIVLINEDLFKKLLPYIAID